MPPIFLFLQENFRAGMTPSDPTCFGIFYSGAVSFKTISSQVLLISVNHAMEFSKANVVFFFYSGLL